MKNKLYNSKFFITSKILGAPCIMLFWYNEIKKCWLVIPNIFPYEAASVWKPYAVDYELIKVVYEKKTKA